MKLHKLLLSPLIAVILLLLLSACEDSEERAERHYQSALALLEAGDVDRALVELRNVIELDTEHIDGRLLFAQTLADQGFIQDAISQFLRVAEQAPERLDARLPLTRMSLELNAWEEAQRHGRAAQELAPTDAEVIFLNAVLDYREAMLAGDMSALDAPLGIAKSTLTQNPRDRLAWRIVLDHALSTGDLNRALIETEAALSNLPDEYDFYVMRLRILSEQDEMAKVGSLLRTMTEQFPDDQLSRNMLMSWFLEQGELAAAEAFLRQLSSAEGAGVVEKLRVVDFLRRTHGADRAREELDRLIAHEVPNKNHYLATLAALDFEEGQTETAIEAMQDLVRRADQSEESANLRINLARMLVSNGQIDEARTLVADVLSETQGHVEALKMQAAWQIEDDLPDDAVLTLRAAQAQAPRDPDIMVLMGQAHERAGAHELAGERFALAVEASGRAPAESLRYADFLIDDNRFDLAETVLNDALAVAPADVELLATLGGVQLRKQNWERVTRLIWRLRMQENPSAIQAADRLETALLLQQHRTDDAIAFLVELTEADAENTRALSNLISTLIQAGKIDAARDMLQDRLQQNPRDPILRYLRASLHLAQGEERPAEVFYRDLLNEYPGDMQSLRQLNRILILQDREDDLAELLEIASASRPDALPPRMMKAEQLERLQDFEGAIKLYGELYATHSGNLVLANNLASLMTTHRNDEESLLRAYTVARRLRGSEIPAFQDTYGWIAFRSGDHAEALDYLGSAAQGLPQNSLVQYHLAEALLAVGRTADARIALMKSIQLSQQQDMPHVARVLELLDSLEGEQ